MRTRYLGTLSVIAAASQVYQWIVAQVLGLLIQLNLSQGALVVRILSLRIACG